MDDGVTRWLSQLSSGDWIALVALIITTVALVVAIQAIRRGSKNTSAATLVAMNEGFRQSWQRYLTASSEELRHYEFSELLNLTEIACAIYLEGSLTGHSRKIQGEYLDNILRMIEGNEETRERLRAAIHSPSTFEFIRRFRRKMPKRSANAMLQAPKRSRDADL